MIEGLELRTVKNSASFANFNEATFYNIVGGKKKALESAEIAKIPWAYACADKLSRSVSNIPYKLVRGEEVWESTGSQESPLPFLTDTWGESSYKVVFDCVTKGAGYMHNRVSDWRHFRKESMTPYKGKSGRVIGFHRQTQNGRKYMTRKYVVEFFWPDASVEDFPAEIYPASVALNPSGSLNAFHDVVNRYFSSGAIGAKVLAMKPPTKREEVKEVQVWWQRMLLGRQNAFSTPKFLHPDTKILELSDKLNEFYHPDIVKDFRREVEVCFYLPETMMNQAANLATKQADQVDFYTNVASPIANWMADQVNRQAEPNMMGWRIVYQVNMMDIMKRNEVEVSAAFKNYVDAGMPMKTASNLLSLDISEDELEQIEDVDEAVVEDVTGEDSPDDSEEIETEEDESRRDEAKTLARWISNKIKSSRAFFISEFKSEHLNAIQKRNVASGVFWKKLEVKQLGDSEADGMIADFESDALDLHQRLQDGEITESEHESEFDELVTALVLALFALGLGDEPTTEDMSEFSLLLEEQIEFGEKIRRDLVRGRYIDKEEQLVNRIALWGTALSSFYILGQVLTDGGTRRFRWLYDPAKEHCNDCAERHNMVKTGDEWKRDVMPRSRDLQCKGYNCGCRLKEV